MNKQIGDTDAYRNRHYRNAKINVFQLLLDLYTFLFEWNEIKISVRAFNYQIQLKYDTS